MNKYILLVAIAVTILAVLAQYGECRRGSGHGGKTGRGSDGVRSSSRGRGSSQGGRGSAQRGRVSAQGGRGSAHGGKGSVQGGRGSAQAGKGSERGSGSQRGKTFLSGVKGVLENLSERIVSRFGGLKGSQGTTDKDQVSHYKVMNEVKQKLQEHISKSFVVTKSEGRKSHSVEDGSKGKGGPPKREKQGSPGGKTDSSGGRQGPPKRKLSPSSTRGGSSIGKRGSKGGRWGSFGGRRGPPARQGTNQGGKGRQGGREQTDATNVMGETRLQALSMI